MTGGVLGMHWSSVPTLGWRPLVTGKGGATCWEACCLNPGCGAVWSLGGRCVLLGCTRDGGCSITSLPQPHQESLGLLQVLSKVGWRQVSAVVTSGLESAPPLGPAISRLLPVLKGPLVKRQIRAAGAQHGGRKTPKTTPATDSVASPVRTRSKP